MTVLTVFSIYLTAGFSGGANAQGSLCSGLPGVRYSGT